jgi:hypothetical protein
MTSSRSAAILPAAVVAVAITAGAPGAVAQNEPAKIGQLDCTVVPSSRQNFIVASTAEVQCSFRRDASAEEYYRGETGVQLGVDLSLKQEERLSFLVYASQYLGQQPGPISLAGKYYGAQASVALGSGVGAFVLLGGSERQFTLAPFGGSASSGSGVTAGVSYLYLEPAQ